LLPLSAHAFFVLFALADEDRHGHAAAVRFADQTNALIKHEDIAAV
jgi:hypothetical protein